jgi:hypothetical protein
MNSALDNVLDRLHNVRKVGGAWMGSCPVQGHGKGQGDRDPSLSVRADPALPKSAWFGRDRWSASVGA